MNKIYVIYVILLIKNLCSVFRIRIRTKAGSVKGKWFPRKEKKPRLCLKALLGGAWGFSGGFLRKKLSILYSNYKCVYLLAFTIKSLDRDPNPSVANRLKPDPDSAYTSGQVTIFYVFYLFFEEITCFFIYRSYNFRNVDLLHFPLSTYLDKI